MKSKANFQLTSFRTPYYLRNPHSQSIYAGIFLKGESVKYRRERLVTPDEDFFDVALGAAIGQKWVNKKGWTFELSLGFGRYLFVKDPEQLLGGPQIDSFRPTGTGRGGFSIGKRF